MTDSNTCVPKKLRRSDATCFDKVVLPAGDLTVVAGAFGYAGGTDGTGSAARVNPTSLVRTSHEYIWNMLLWYGRDVQGNDIQKARELFKRELFGVDEPLGRVVDYFKAAAAGWSGLSDGIEFA